MPKFSANLSCLFTEIDFLDRFAAAKKAGFAAVEFLFPYEHASKEIADKLKDNHLKQILFNMRPGNWQEGERGLAILPDRRDDFKNALAEALDYARALDCRNLHCMAGIIPDEADLYELERTFITNLKFATSEAAKAGIRILIEAINNDDMPGYYLNYTDQAADIINQVGADNLFIQFDLYHQQKMQGDIAATFKRYQPLIGHLQLADNPGRAEPGTGEINFAFLFQYFDKLGYDGWIGCEYKPSSHTLDSLAWRDELIV